MSYGGCVPGYNNFSENIHYYYQFAYLLPAICLNYRILYVIWISQRHIYSSQSFYNLYSIDCAISILAMNAELMFTRLFHYFPQFCESLSGIVAESPIFMKLYHCSTSYFKAVKPVIHIFVAVNRMSCVMFPVTYSQNWSHNMRATTVFILLAPFLVIWNLPISDNTIIFVNGGFLINYERRVKWASLSFMQLMLLIITVLITMITTTVTFYKMKSMKNRIKSSERALCLAAALISVGFLLEAVSEGFFAFFKQEPWIIHIMNYVVYNAWDILFVGSPIVLFLASKQFREHVLGRKMGRTLRVSSINNTHQNLHQSHNTLMSF